MLRKAKDQLRDRIKPQGVSNFRTGLRNAGRTGGGSHARPKTGMSLQYKSLQPDPEFEAVLDDIHTSSNPVFAVSEDPNSKPSHVSQPVNKSKSGGPRKESRKSAASSEPMYPESDEEEDDTRGQPKTGIDPLLGQVLNPETDSGHTDSEDESEDQLELDAETVNVLESLRLTDSTQDDLFGGESPSSGWSHANEGSKGKGRAEQSSEVESGTISAGETPSNESVTNNDTRIHVESQEEVGEALPHTESSLTSRQPDSAGVPVVISSNANTCQREASDEVRPPSPSLDDLLEHGSAALHSHHNSPLYGSPHSPHSSLPEFSPSPLTSSNEVETNEALYSVTNQLCPPAASNSQTISPTEPQILINSHDQTHTDPDEIDSSRRMDTEEKVALKEAAVDDLFADATAHQPSPIDIAPEKQARRNLFVEEKDVLGLSPTSDHPLDQSDDGEGGPVREMHTLTCTSKSHMPDSEDELFPDDAKHLQDLEKSSAAKSKNALDIKEDHFSSSPGEQRKKAAPPRPSPPALSRQNTSGKVAPPRPPRSPQLTARLKLQQNKALPKAKSPVAVHSPSTQKPVVERAGVKMTKTLESAPTGMATNISNTNVCHPKMVLNRSHENQETPPLECLDSNVSPPPPQTVLTKAVDTSQQEHIDLDDKVVFSEPAFFPLHIHLLLVGILYIYYSFNPFVYLAGLMAGFLTFYLMLGAVFVLYVQNEEEVAASAESPIPELSPDFMKSMNVRLEDYNNAFKTRKFTATLQYDLATHHRRDRMSCDLQLFNDFKLQVLVWTSDSEVVLKETYDLHKDGCRITIVPQDVFTNRKRRWSKKYPIRIQVSDFEFFLFADTSRKKEEWFRRLREAVEGTTTEQLIERQKSFFQYMQQYFPHEPLRPPHARASTSTTTRFTGPPSRQQQRRHKPSVGSVQYSSTTSREDFDDGTISISKSKSSASQLDHSVSITSSISSISSYGLSSPNEHHELHHTSKSSDGRAPSISSAHTFSINSVSDYMVTSQPAPLETDWINVLAARLCWDVWHEKRWKDWIMCRIQRKLVRIKTPGFLENLELTDIAIGNKMPVVNRLHEGPYVKVDGVWVYLDVTYEGLFVMTIKTKLKLGGSQEEEKGTEMKFMKHPSSSKGGDGGVLSHSQAAQIFQYSSVDPEDDSDTGSEEETTQTLTNSTHTLTNPPDTEILPPARPPPPQASALLTNKKKERRAKLKSVVTRITKKVASTRLVRKAAERVSSVPLELTVEVKSLRGILAMNIPPPHSDTIWYGFKETPKLELVAKPRLGKKAVTLSQVTHWIERKLCSLVDEKLTLPNMEDLVIPILNSGLPEDTQKPLPSPDPNT